MLSGSVSLQAILHIPFEVLLPDRCCSSLCCCWASSCSGTRASAAYSPCTEYSMPHRLVVMGVRAIAVGFLRCNCLGWRDSREFTALWRHKQAPGFKNLCQVSNSMTLHFAPFDTEHSACYRGPSPGCEHHIHLC
jgi:hypothetical protein